MCYNAECCDSHNVRLIFEVDKKDVVLSGDLLSTHVPVAQLDRASACGAEGRTFESYRAYHVGGGPFK